jgi:ligand-binding SRPBCC domain-containing protein
LIHAAPERVFAFHELPDALARLTPPWERVRVVQAAHIAEVGSEAIIETRIAGLLPTRWVARHTVYDPPRMFEDVQVAGPFRLGIMHLTNPFSWLWVSFRARHALQARKG